MAIDEEAGLWPTENLLLKKDRKHYRTTISPIHWQLRSLISAERKDIIYFPSGLNNTHITRLNTTTRECETIKVLSFHPRCLVAKGGWVCCGGELGEFTVIHDASQNDSVDDVLANDIRSTMNSLDSAQPSRSQGTPSLTEASMSQLHNDMLSIVERIHGTNKTWSASNHKFGTERVNCITIWQPPKPPSDPPTPAQYSCPVAVLANNDKTITIVNLQDNEMIDELEYPDCVNRGVISPDGTLLVAICDDPFLYVHVRCSLARGKRGEYFDWVPLPRIRLKSQQARDISDNRGSFAACFSPSGRYLAVGSQYGTISIFDVVALADPNKDPLITYFKSARAPTDKGAVRDMAFAPGPHDLLAWTEHRGRVGIADARTNFAQRQIISIDDHQSFDHISLNDKTTIDPRLLDPRSEREANSSGSGLPSLMSQHPGRPLPNPDAGDTSRINHPFTAEETAILEAVQSDRRRREAREQRERQDGGRGSAAAWRSSVWAERRDTLTRILERERNRESRDQHRAAAAQSPAETDRERRAPTPRRRSSIMQALTQNVQNYAQGIIRDQGSGSNEGSARESPWQSGRFTSGWSDLEALYNISGDGAETIRDTVRTFAGEGTRTRRAIPVITDVWHDDIGGFRRTYAYPRAGSREHQQNPDDTAGLTWSEDGRTLYVGAEDGIYELQVNMRSRKIFSDIALR